MDMLGVIKVQHPVLSQFHITSSYDLNLMFFCGSLQAQKIAELLLDLKVNSIVSSPKDACVETAIAISKVSSC